MSPTSTNTQSDVEQLDAIIVGGGFSGTQLLFTLRQKGYKVKLFEAADGYGGTWRNAKYPGARVDSEVPLYTLKYPEVWRSWSWSQRYPDYKEIRRYFDHVDKVLDLSRNTYFNARVRSAHWNDDTNRWDVTADGPKPGDAPRRASARLLFLCLGFASRITWPDIANREAFKGQMYHAGIWPEGLEPEHLAGKKIGQIGTGASGVQITQELGPLAEKLTLFVRTPNLCLPMYNPKLSKESQDIYRDGWDVILDKRSKTFAGFHYDFDYGPWERHSAEERRDFFEEVWSHGGFHFWLETYADVYFKKECNDTAYAFWHSKVAPRIVDPHKRAVLAPPLEQAHHTFGTVRPSLETTYYDVCNRDNVEVVPVKKNPILRFTETGVELQDGTRFEFDVLVLATGYDTHTGGFHAIDIRGQGGKPLTEHWKDGCRTYLGLSTAGFPNMFWLYGPHGPTAFSNGPSTADVQTEWLLRLVDYMDKNDVKALVAEPEAEQRSTERVNALSSASLFHKSHGWYMGRNVKGKPVQPLNYTGGVPSYVKDLEASADAGFEGYAKIVIMMNCDQRL